MHAGYLAYWGKADEKVGGHHPAVLHGLDVAAVAEHLLIARSRLNERISRWLAVPEEAVPPTVALLVALHDIGKIDARFQAKAPAVARTLSPAWARLERRLGESYDHGAAGFGHLLRDHRDLVEECLGEASWSLLQAVTGHHGSFPSRASALRAAAWGDRAWLAASRADALARSEWLRSAVALFRARGAVLPIVAEPGAPLVTLLAGLCSVADWIGSDVENFPYARASFQPDDYYAMHSRPRAKAALDSLALRAGVPSNKTFGEIFPGWQPRDVQLLTETLHLPQGPCLVLVEAQMASGKTEAALSLAERWLARGDSSGLYFALPTMATSNAMLDRLERDVPRMFNGRVSLVLAHAKRELNEGFQRLARSTPSAAPYSEEATVVCGRWLLGRKRALLGQVGVGTIDQAMLAALRVRHHFVRAYALAGSVVVMDEVHAYDAYMQVILDRLVEWLGALGAPVVLLSATLPETKRRLFAEAYARGAGFTLGAPPNRAPANAPYPLVTVVSGSGAIEEAKLDEVPASRSVAIELLATPTPTQAILPRLVQAASAGGRVCWIRNTVSDAQAAWEEGRALGVERLLLFHARMRAADRAAIEARVLAEFGKGRASAPPGALLIATQVVEQSLDLDFDLLATDLCPIDLFLQRVGRLHRHIRDRRPPGCDVPRVLVVVPEGEAAAKLDFGASGYVYDRATLGLTIELLAARSALSLPADIRPLVEAIYDPASREKLLEKAANAKALREAETAALAKLARRRAHAQRACVAPAVFDPVAAESAYSDDDEVVQALTRDGDSTTLLPLLWDGEVGRALDGTEPWRLDATTADAWNEARALLEQMVSVPAYPWEQIERGARPRGEAPEWESWQKRAHAFLDAVGLGEPVLVPMRDAGNGEWRGCVQTNRGELRRLAYSVEKGLWFRRG